MFKDNVYSTEWHASFLCGVKSQGSGVVGLPMQKVKVTRNPSLIPYSVLWLYLGN